MRIEHAEQRIRQLWELVIQPMLHPGAEEGDAFQQSFDMRIIDRIGGETQAAGDLRMRLGEAGAQAAERGQFLIIIGQQRVRHPRHSSPAALPPRSSH